MKVAARPAREEALAAVLGELSTEVAVFANGMISREACRARDRRLNFYMLGSMGLGTAIGLGLSLSRPSEPVVVVDGDGNLLMGLGTLPMVGAWVRGRFLHVVLDNGTYASTGGQKSVSGTTDFGAVALASGYARAGTVETTAELRSRVQAWLEEDDPSLLRVLVADEPPHIEAPRVSERPERIAARVARELAHAG
jgi:thiamine pyrophosphate-dependent acetolactate synthase large subunit-like protein